MPEAEQKKVKKESRIKLPKLLKNRYFVFGLSVVLFLLSVLVLILIDENNTFRPKWADFVFNWLKTLNLTFDVHMSTWLIVFILFGVFWAFFFILMFRKHLLKKKNERALRKYDRELNDREIAVFNFVFIFSVAILAAAAIAGAFIFLNVTGYMKVIAEQFTDLPRELANFFFSLLMLIAFLAIPPIIFLLLILVFKFIIIVVGLFASGVSNSVMRSEGFQKNMAASQAAAQDISRSMREARDRAGDAVARAREAMNGGGGANTPQADIIFPALTSIDLKWAKIEEEKKKEEEAKAAEAAKQAEAGNEPLPEAKPEPLPEEVKEEPTPEEASQVGNGEDRPPLDYEQFKLLAYEFQSYLCHQKYYFKINTLRSFIAGLSAARLILLQGLSGTGKSTLPRVFLEYVGGDAYFFPVQATWRDRSDITGYYSDFTGQFKETELLKHLYEASYIPETTNLMVLDEMNISRVEYYFADFLSIFEYPSEDWVVPLMQVKPGTVLPKYIENGMVRIPTNTWFVGTVNIDDSTFTITDKVYDRAIAIDFNELNLPFESSYRFDRHPIKITELTAMFEECKSKKENNLTPAERQKFLELTKFISDTFDIQYGNRIMNQIDNFLPVFVGLGGSKNEALDFMIARKVLRKLEGKFESYIKDGLNKLTRYINTSYGKHVLVESEAAIEKYRRKLS